MKEREQAYALKFVTLKKRAFMALFLLMSLFIVLLLALADLNKQFTTQITTFNSEKNITIDGRSTAAASLIAPYETMDIFISEEQNPGFKFTTVGGSWEQSMPHNTRIDAEVRFKVDGEWQEWLHLDAEDDFYDENVKVATASSNPATAMQYKFIMYGNGKEVPFIKNPEWTFLKTGKTISHLEDVPTPQFAANNAIPIEHHLYKDQVTSNDVNVIPRSIWGANESYRYLDEDHEGDAQLIELDEDFYKEFSDELGYSLVVDGDSDGDFIWPLQYPNDVKKFIVHHTASSKNLDDPDQAIRDIYYYHAISRGWGDIGYNFLIDQEGKVYEGRYGGDGVIGAHAGPGNNGSVGIALLGNFEEDDVPEQAMISLSNLIANKSKVHDVNPDGYATFRGQAMPNIFGHKDIMRTACPGTNLYSQLDLVRSLAASAQEEKEKFVKNFDYENLSDLYFIQMKPGEEMELELKLENIGLKDWDSNTFLSVNLANDFEDVISLPSSDGAILAKMDQEATKSGDTATFKFDLNAGKKGDLVQLNIALFANGDTKINDLIQIPVLVEQTQYKYSLISTDYPAEGMEDGEEFKATVEIKNTGNITWTKTGDNKVVLQASHKEGRKSAFIQPTSATMGYMQEEKVEPGETASFEMKLKAPSKSGYYQEYFTPYVINQDIWMADIGMYFETVIYSEDYAAEFISLNYVTEWTHDKGYQIKIKIRNLGKQSWTEDDMKLHLLRDKDLVISDLVLEEDLVKTGDIATLKFTAKAPSTEQAGHKAIIVRPKINGEFLIQRPIVIHYKLEKQLSQEDIWESTVQVPTNTDIVEGEGSQPDIRIKLSFQGNPKITADKSFTIYSDGEKVVDLKAGEEAEAISVNGKYQIKTDEDTFIVNDEVRFVPDDEGILEIVNFDNAPAWNPDLNDNMYRGILEVQEVDGELVVINELPLELYLRGLGEVSNTEEYEKVKAIITAARTYAHYYTENVKFPGKPYDLDDDPDVSQKYLGYGFEMRAPAITQAVLETTGQVVTYDGELIKTPYFNQSDGTQTKSAEDVWGWTHTPYLVSVDDSFCDGDIFYGHGVGMSGCGAKGMAKLGHSYVQILKHYYTGVEVTDFY